MLDQERTYGTHIHEDQEDISGLVVHDMSAMSHGPFVPTFVVFYAYLTYLRLLMDKLADTFSELDDSLTKLCL